MISLEKAQCCGCGACAEICPKKCITMAADAEGFLYPEVNRQNCINCNLCVKSCPVCSDNAGNTDNIAYAAYCKNEECRIKSSSGGIFTQIAEEILKMGGVVFGAAFDADWTVHHIAVDTCDGLEQLRGSKYLQSRTEDTFQEVKKNLEQGRTVLYSGTPCEIEGLKSYLGKEYDALYTQDLICHGSPSPKLWKKYLAYQEKKNNAKVQEVSFRHKKYGWGNYCLFLGFSNGVKLFDRAAKNWYMQMFVQDLCLRPSCYQCAFKKMNRASDLTLADFWGGDEICPELSDDKGLSLVLVHSQKGKDLLNRIKDKVVCKRVDAQQALASNPSIIQSVPKPFMRDDFMEHLDTVEIDQLAKLYLRHPTIKSRIGNMLPKKVKKQIVAWLSTVKK